MDAQPGDNFGPFPKPYAEVCKSHSNQWTSQCFVCMKWVYIWSKGQKAFVPRTSWKSYLSCQTNILIIQTSNLSDTEIFQTQRAKFADDSSVLCCICGTAWHSAFWCRAPRGRSECCLLSSLFTFTLQHDPGSKERKATNILNITNSRDLRSVPIMIYTTRP